MSVDGCFVRLEAKLFFLVAVALGTVMPSSSAALPWDEDLFKQQSLKANEIARAPAQGTVPLGHQPFRLSAEEADKQLQNPVPFVLDSVWHGQRLYNANCSSCHGKRGVGDGPVGKAMAVPDLTTDFYRQRSDGRIFAVIHNGGMNMPRYGYKFAAEEHWHIVNYLRFLQGKSVSGMNRP